MRRGIKILISFIVLLFMMPLTKNVSAAGNKVTAIDIRVQLHEDGSATIQEKRTMDVSEGTEVYIELSNLGASDLTDFQVKGFEEEADWDLDASFEEKAYKYGVMEIGEGYELAWGISEYGTQNYELTYGLTNLVRDLEDGQALFWNFDTFLSLPTDQLTLEVAADFDIGEVIQEFYGFGFEGRLDIVDGVVQWQGSNLDEANNVSVLLQFPQGTFQTTATEDMTLVEQRQMAVEGSSYNDSAPMPTWLKLLISFFVFLGISGTSAAVAYGIKRNKIRKAHNYFEPHQLIRQNKNRTSRTPPTITGDLPNYAAIISKLASTGAGFSEFFFAYLLLWAERGRITLDLQEKQGFFGRNKKQATIQIENFDEEYAINSLAFDEYVELFEIGESTFEEVIWGMLLEVADANGKVEGPRIEKWSEKNAESIDTLVQSLETVSKEWLVANDYLKMYSVKDWGAEFKIEELTAKGEKLAIEIILYQNFMAQLKEVSLDQNEQWESLMLWSVILGHAEETIEYLEEFEPETWAYLEDAYPYYYGNYYGYHYLYTRNTTGLVSGGYSSTGGGMSSGGGGMGAGGGGGGGTR